MDREDTFVQHFWVRSNLFKVTPIRSIVHDLLLTAEPFEIEFFMINATGRQAFRFQRLLQK